MAYGSRPGFTIIVLALAAMANSECSPAIGVSFPWRFSTSISPVRCARRRDTGV
jgi:hypothetical protein